MSWWLIALIILLALFLIGRLRVGARIRYSPVGLILAVIVGPARFRVFPVKEKPKKAGMKKEKRSERRREKDLQRGRRCVATCSVREYYCIEPLSVSSNSFLRPDKNNSACLTAAGYSSLVTIP